MKELGVLETELVGHLIKGQFLVHHVLLQEVDDLVLYMATDGHTSFFLDEIAEVAGREEHLLCEIGDEGQTLALSLSTAEVRLQVVLETGHDVSVHLVARDECLRVLIDEILVFFLDISLRYRSRCNNLTKFM